MSRRVAAQLVLLVIGLVVWAYGHRVDEPSLRLTGIALFAAATLLRFFKPSRGGPAIPDREEDGDDRPRTG